jgi:hypothetical protein
MHKTQKGKVIFNARRFRPDKNRKFSSRFGIEVNRMGRNYGTYRMEKRDVFA